MSKITLANLANLQNETTAVAAINANSAVVTTAMDNTLSRDGTAPNQMSSALDMNSSPIINLPAAVSSSSPLRLAEAQTIIAGTSLRTDANVYNTISAATIANISSTVQGIRVLGYSVVGDNGAASYKKRVGIPAHQGYFTSADGAIWEIAEAELKLENFGAKGDGATNDKTAVTNALAAGVTLGKRVLGCKEANYKMVGGIIRSFTGVDFDGRGCTFTAFSLAPSERLFYFLYDSSSAGTTLGGSPAVGDNTIVVNSAAGMAAGQLLNYIITRPDTLTQGFCTRIHSVVGTTITLETAIPAGADSIADLNAIGTYTVGTGGRFVNAVFEGANATANNASAFLIQGAINAHIERLRFNNWVGDGSVGGAFSTDICYQCVFRDLEFFNSGTAGAADASFTGTSCTIDNVSSHDAFGFSLQFARCALFNVSNISVQRANGRAIKLEGCISSNFNNIFVSEGAENGFAIAHRSQYNRINNLMVIGCRSAIPSSRNGIWFSDSSDHHNTITNFVSLGNIDLDLTTSASDTNNQFVNGFIGGLGAANLTDLGKSTFINVNGRSWSPWIALTLVNGDNNDIALPSSGDYFFIAGPSAGFALTGFVAGKDGQRITIHNPLAQTMTLKEDVTSSAVNRLYTLGGNLASTGVSSASFVYSLTSQRWILTAWNP